MKKKIGEIHFDRRKKSGNYLFSVEWRFLQHGDFLSLRVRFLNRETLFYIILF